MRWTATVCHALYRARLPQDGSLPSALSNSDPHAIGNCSMMVSSSTCGGTWKSPLQQRTLQKRAAETHALLAGFPTMTYLPTTATFFYRKAVTIVPCEMDGRLFCLCFHGLEAAAADHSNFILVLTDDQSGSGLPYKCWKIIQRREVIFIALLRWSDSRSKECAHPRVCTSSILLPPRRAIQTGLMPARHEYHRNRSQWTDWYR